MVTGVGTTIFFPTYLPVVGVPDLLLFIVALGLWPTAPPCLVVGGLYIFRLVFIEPFYIAGLLFHIRGELDSVLKLFPLY